MSQKKRVGENLRNARLAVGLTQRDVAEILGVAQASVSRWENGDREAGYDSLTVMASTYGTTVGGFFDAPPPAAAPDPLLDELNVVARKLERRIRGS